MFILFCIFVVMAICMIGAFIASLTEEEFEAAALFLFILIICITFSIMIHKSDDARALKNKNVDICYDYVENVTPYSIVLDNNKYVLTDNEVQDYYKVNLTQINKGDVVEYTILHGDFYDYLIGVNKIK